MANGTTTLEWRSARGPRIRLGMVGGGEDAFIGAVHRLAARMDDHYELVAGALSSSPDKAKRSGWALGLTPERTYTDYMDMARRERARADGIEAACIVTPNDMHAPVATAFLDAGIHVICDKPLTTGLAAAKALQQAVERSGRIFALTHNYSGYPMIRQMRAMVRSGALGDIRVVQIEYPQDWLTEKLEASGHKQAQWRTDPARAGLGGCIGDIGTHAFHLAGFVAGIPVTQILAELTTFVPGRALDDHVQVLLRYANGARGILWASQVTPGHENGLRLRIYGSKGGLEWHQEEPNALHWSPFGQPKQRLTRGGYGTGPEAAHLTRVPSGHSEGYLEGFANIYNEVATAIYAAREGKPVPADCLFPTVADGVRGIAFVEAAIESSRRGGVWVGLPA